MKTRLLLLWLLARLASPSMASGQALSSFAPGAGAPGAVVTLTGQNLTGVRDVSFGGVSSVSFTATSATTISAVVPQQAATGKITVTTPGATLQSAADFRVLVPASSLPSGPVAGVSLVKADLPFTLLNNYLFFNTLEGGGRQLWRSDGTAAGTRSVSSSLRTAVNVAYALASEKYLYFFEQNSAGQKRLVALDESLARKELSTPTSSNDTYALLNQKAIFERDFSLWVFDELTGTSRQLLDFSPHLVVAHRGLAYFKGNPGSGGYGIGRTDGTAAGTFLLSSSASLYADQFAGAGEYMYLATSTPTTSTTAATLYRTKGEAGAGLTAISGFVGDIRQLTDVNGTLFFFGRASSGATGWELYKVTNTTAELVADLAPGAGNGVHERVKPAVIGKTLYFQGEGSQGVELWKSDGTAAGTVLVKDLNPDTGSTYPDYLTAVGNQVYFVGTSPTGDRLLHVTDGTAAGTRALSFVGRDLLYLTYFRGVLVCSASTPDYLRRELHLYNLASAALPTARPLAALGFELYPNPTPDFVTVRAPASSGPWAGALYNQLGQQLAALSFTAGAPLTIDLRRLPAGVYQLRVADGREYYTASIVKP